MYNISKEFYRDVALRLCDAINGDSYFSGSITGNFDDTEWRLTLSVIIYRREECAPEGISHPITNLVPVWWEIHTFDNNSEILNDFEFSELKEYIL